MQDAVVSDRALKAEVERLPRALQTVWYHETRRKEAKRPTDDAGADGSGDEEATSPTAGPPRIVILFCLVKADEWYVSPP